MPDRTIISYAYWFLTAFVAGAGWTLGAWVISKITR